MAHSSGTLGESVAARTSTAPELYPTLGVLLTRLCVNPVVLASDSIANLVAQSVSKYSMQTNHYSQSSWNRLSAERAWCTRRLRGMLQNSQYAPLRTSQKQHIQDLEMRTSDTRGFAELFGVSKAEMKQQRFAQTTEALSQCLNNLVCVVSTTRLTGVSLAFMIAWSRQLSGLCAPLVSYPAAAVLVRDVIDLAYSLKTRADSTLAINPSIEVLDSAFVEQTLLCSRDGDLKNKILLEDSQVLRFCNVSSLARQRYLIHLTDKIMKASAEQPGFVLDRGEVFSKFIASSQLVSTLARGLKETNGEYTDLVHSTLEDIAALAGEIPDWRFIRICTLLIEWILTRGRRGEPSRENDSLGSDCRSGLYDFDNVPLTPFEAMVSASCCLLQNHAHGFSTRPSSLEELDRLAIAQRDYIYCFAGPDRLILRKRLAFLVSMVIAQHNEFLIRHIRCHFESLDMGRLRQGQDNEFVADKNLVAFIADLILTDDSEQWGSSVLHEQLTGLLQELRTVCPARVGQNSTLSISMGPLKSVLAKYEPILHLNKALLADIVCALGIFADANDSALWKSMIRVAVSVMHEPESTSYANIRSLPFIARLHDISENMQVLGLNDALEAIVATKD
ncbi:hypothetical protein BGX21_010703 [Mortierella sp. AD011]|nr:hypothetical protein BGX20_008494 [Mortierella sp. AD010]KAF9402279.1 hypothetical protein BGX21_010703 [Mortierella sp. AD011]